MPKIKNRKVNKNEIQMQQKANKEIPSIPVSAPAGTHSGCWPDWDPFLGGILPYKSIQNEFRFCFGFWVLGFGFYTGLTKRVFYLGFLRWILQWYKNVLEGSESSISLKSRREEAAERLEELLGFTVMELNLSLSLSLSLSL